MGEREIPTKGVVEAPRGAHGRQGRRATLEDVARRAGVSKPVASRALGGYTGVAAATRDRVIAAAAALGYHASLRARALTGGLQMASCALVPLGITPEAAARDRHLGPILAGIVASAQGLDLHIVGDVPELSPAIGAPDEPGAAVPAASRSAVQLALARLVAEDRADAFLLLTRLPLSPADVAPLERAGVPFVLVNRHLGDYPANCVTLDFAGAMAASVEYLVDRGHRRLALLLPEPGTTAVDDREAGWRAGVARCGLAPGTAPVLRFSGDRLAGGFAWGQRLLLDGLPEGQTASTWPIQQTQPARPARAIPAFPTAIVAYNDFCALGVCRAAKARGVDVPEQLSVIGMGNVIAPYTTPALTSFSLNAAEVGAAAVRLVTAALRGDLATPRHIRVPICLSEGASTGPAPGGDV